MHVTPRIFRTWCIPGLLVLLAGLLAESASAQSGVRTRASTPPNHLRATGSGVRSQGFVPQHVRMASATRVVTEEDVVEGGMYMQDPDTGQLYATNGSVMPPGEPMMSKNGPILPDGAFTESIPMDAACGTTCGTDACMAPCAVLPIGNFELFGGVEGFTGPRNRGGSGSFGFNEGLNYATPLPGFGCLGGQIGFRATQSNLSGSNFTTSNRNQGFVTAGLFRRVDVGLQGGIVVDYMTESWYDDIDLVNLRGELSWVVDGIHDFGFWFAGGSRSSQTTVANGTAAPVNEDWVSTDLYAFFYRMKFGCDEGEARLFAGWSDNSDGLIGVDSRLPLGPSWALETNFTYLIPQEGTGAGFAGGHTQEAWNLGLSLVWYPGRCWGANNSYYRPLFRVADNGVFMVDRAKP